MKVLVLWEHPNERDYACNLAEVLGVIGGSLAAEAKVEKDGSITQTYIGRAVPKMVVQAANYFRAFGSHHRVHADPTVWDDPEPAEPTPPAPPPVTDPLVWLHRNRGPLP